MFVISESNLTNDDDYYLNAMLDQQMEIHTQLMVKSNIETLTKIINGSYEVVVNFTPENKQELDRLRNEILNYCKKPPFAND